ncbi:MULTISPECIES: pyridoxal phosphate-dependent aminotransferase [unclassified Lysobacter]|uniref:pyridoxal phosphate-dependent aminotransferase n=1 Tax=unclassified Lysobacter TaxID=2635362 RepID=UPI001BE57113|nr:MULTISPECIES: pyridoxal phosphate-dependent aminotransferase [unclassified Lysobacter]MBT2746758.1 pyridoxal phosphate-dependent aminotransferase [Lysobacter sp. ISL-42]MBT2751807.1 pyridoxal phosphate-dependent aminotransferase [Lysobacter sp. ISL-50]MBT2778159.1 pyridoxal phosphate-dependent aminotransferase [Lysobacter sp. ISL-54]MBT2781800.1 pyridoxal phosphate-dependent aminotransferase [Lysobacter sp. ISL-52]
MTLATKLPKVGTTIFTVMSQLALEHQAVNLGQGFPDFDVPERLIEALNRAMREGKNQYAPMTGIPALRQAIAAKTEACYGYRPDADSDITVVSGASEAIFDAIHAVVRPGEEVIVLDPCYDSYEPAIDLAGGVAVHVPLDPHTFAVDWDRVRAAVTPKTRMLMINSPHNPSGAMFDADDIARLGELLNDTGIWLLSDEVYEHIVFDGRRHESVLRYPQLRERAFVVSSFGKTYHCTGWKIGYCIAPAALSAELRKVHQYNSFCSFAPAQWAFAEMIEAEPGHYLELGAFYQDKRDSFREQLLTTRLKPLPVPGGYFQLVDYSEISDLADAEFCRWLTVEKGVAAIPLSPFYESPPHGQRLARLCFAKNRATLDAAIKRLVAL